MENQNKSFLPALVFGICLILCVLVLKTGFSSRDRFEFKQEGPIFLRFDKIKGEMCYTGLAPNGKLVTESWLCLAGDNTKEMESAKPKDAEKAEENKNKAKEKSKK